MNDLEKLELIIRRVHSRITEIATVRETLEVFIDELCTYNTEKYLPKHTETEIKF